jgi:hypothetical protein
MVCALFPAPAAAAQNKVNTYSVLLNNCSKKELVINFTYPITNKLYLAVLASDSNELMQRLATTKLSKIFSADRAGIILDFDTPPSDEQIDAAVNEVVQILSGYKQGMMFQSAGPYSLESYPCGRGQGYGQPYQTTLTYIATGTF